MATTTTRLGLRKPNPAPVVGDLVDAQADLNDNFDKIDAAIALPVVTSVTRPSSPYVGMTAYESDTRSTIVCVSTGPAVWRYISNIVSVNANTDITAPYTGQGCYATSTGLRYRYNGTVWLVDEPGKIAATHKPTGSASSVGTTETVAMVVSIGANVGQRIKARAQADLSSSGTTTASIFRIRAKQTASTTDVTGTLLSGRDCLTSGASNNPIDCFGDFTVVTSGVQTVVFTILAANGSGNAVMAYNATGHIPNLTVEYA
jgi:hypothetical protein